MAKPQHGLDLQWGVWIEGLDNRLFQSRGRLGVEHRERLAFLYHLTLFHEQPSPKCVHSEG